MKMLQDLSFFVNFFMVTPKHFISFSKSSSHSIQVHSYFEVSAASATDYKHECVREKVRVGTGEYFKWIEGFLT